MCLGALLDEVDGSLDGGDLLDILLGDLDLELLLEGHDELDGVKGVGIEVGHEAGGVVELTLHIELGLDDVADALLDVVGGHVEGGGAAEGGACGGGEGGGRSGEEGGNGELHLELFGYGKLQCENGRLKSREWREIKMPDCECEVEHRLQIERSIPNTGGKSLVGKFLPVAGTWFVTQANGDPATSKGSRR